MALLFSKQDPRTGMGRILREWLASLNSHQENPVSKTGGSTIPPEANTNGARPGIAAVTAPLQKRSVRSRRAKVADTGGIAPHPAHSGTIRFRNGSPHYRGSVSKVVRPEVVATSPYPGKSRVPVYCGLRRKRNRLNIQEEKSPEG